MQQSALLVSGPMFVVQPGLATAIGLNEAIFLQQLHYWLQQKIHIYDEKSWVYNSVDQWCKQFPFWSKSTIERILRSLRKQQLIVTTKEYNQSVFDQRLWYTIGYEVVESLNLTVSDLQHGLQIEGFDPTLTDCQHVDMMDCQRLNMTDCHPFNMTDCSIFKKVTTKNTTKITTTTEEDVVVVALSTHGLSRPIALGFAERYPEEYLCEKMAFLEFEKTRRPDLANPAGWLRRAIEEDFAPPPGYQTPEQQAEADHREVEMFAAQHQEYDAIRERQQAKVAARFAQQLAILQPRYGTTESLLTAWVEGREYVTNVFSPGNILQFLDQTVLLSFANRRAQIGVWEQVALDQLALRGKQIIKETLAYAMRDALDGGTGTYELVLVAGAGEA